MASLDLRKALRQSHDSVLEIYDETGTFLSGVGKLVNFSDKGACFSSAKKLPKDAKLLIRMKNLDQSQLDFSAQIVWVKPKVNSFLYGIALEPLR